MAAGTLGPLHVTEDPERCLDELTRSARPVVAGGSASSACAPRSPPAASTTPTASPARPRRAPRSSRSRSAVRAEAAPPWSARPRRAGGRRGAGRGGAGRRRRTRRGGDPLLQAVRWRPRGTEAAKAVFQRVAATPRAGVRTAAQRVGARAARLGTRISAHARRNESAELSPARARDRRSWWRAAARTSRSRRCSTEREDDRERAHAHVRQARRALAHAARARLSASGRC